MKFFSKTIKLFIISCLITLTSCTAIKTAVTKRKLDVQTKMSSTIFLDPVPSSLKTIYLQVRNTTDKEDFNLEGKLRESLRNKGYTIVQNPNIANYILQANILQAGRSDKSAANKSFLGGFGDEATAGAAGFVIGNRKGSVTGGVVGGIIAGGATLVTNALVKDIHYSVITDLQISEKLSGYSSRKIHRTRILSSANKVNLKWEKAEPELEKGLAKSISGIF